MRNYFVQSSMLAGVLFAGFAMTAQGQMNADKQWATKAAGGGMAEVKLGQLAQDHAASQQVKDFGQRMVDDHSKANDQLKSIASNKGISLPSDMDPKDQAVYTRLSSLHGAAFDRAYMNDMVKDHKTDIAEFQKESQSGSDPDLKQFATSTLPTLQKHLQMAEMTLKSVH